VSGGPDKKSVATLLVEIAEDLFTFGSVSEQRGHTSRIPGDDPVAVYTYASPKLKPDMKRPLADIRSDLAAVYQAQYGDVPSAHALGDAMTVLEGKARAGAPEQVDAETLATVLAGGQHSVSTRLVKIAKETFTFGVTTTGEVYAVPVDGPNIARALRGGRRSLRHELARIYFEKTKVAANAQALADALLVLEGEANGADPSEVALRVGRDPVDGRLVLDLGRDDGQVVLIGAYGWEVTDRSPVLFWRTNATLPLPIPDEMGSVDDLRGMLNVSDADCPLILAWLICALIPDMPHPVLLLKGEHGTAKSTVARLLTSLLDRCASQLRTAPRNVEDWAVACAGSWMTCLDNVSDVQPWLQDAICRAVTGDGLLRRELYTNSDVTVLAFRRVIALTSIDPGPLNGDLADRLLTVELERIPDTERSSEYDMEAKWSTMQPGVLGGLLHVTVNVLRALGPVRHTNLPRMADFARVLIAVDEVKRTTGYATYTEQTGRTAEQVADADSVAIAIREQITAEWTGTAGELLKILTSDRPPTDWPSTPQGMGGRLTRAAPTLRAIHWTVDRPPRSDQRGSRLWHLAPPSRQQPAEKYPAPTSGPPAASEPLLPQLNDSGDSDDPDDADNLAGYCSCGRDYRADGSCPHCD
jgi:hypothetical protein